MVGSNNVVHHVSKFSTSDSLTLSLTLCEDWCLPLSQCMHVLVVLIIFFFILLALRRSTLPGYWYGMQLKTEQVYLLQL